LMMKELGILILGRFIWDENKLNSKK